MTATEKPRNTISKESCRKSTGQPNNNRKTKINHSKTISKEDHKKTKGSQRKTREAIGKPNNIIGQKWETHSKTKDSGTPGHQELRLARNCTLSLGSPFEIERPQARLLGKKAVVSTSRIGSKGIPGDSDTAYSAIGREGTGRSHFCNVLSLFA